MIGDREARRISLFFRPMRECPSGANLQHSSRGGALYASAAAPEAATEAATPVPAAKRAIVPAWGSVLSEDVERPAALRSLPGCRRQPPHADFARELRYGA